MSGCCVFLMRLFVNDKFGLQSLTNDQRLAQLISKCEVNHRTQGTIMHFAICFWGLLRALQYTIDSYDEFILKPLDQYNHTYDVIVHTYNFSGAYKSNRNKEEAVALNFSNWKLLNPFYLYIENQDDFDQLINYPLYEKKGDPWRNNFTSFQNHVRALNSLYHGTKVAESLHATRHYDGIIYIRPDVKFIHPLPIELLHKKNLSQCLFLPDFHRSCQGLEYNDRMAIATVPEGFRYGKKMEIALKYSLTNPLHAEKFTYFHLHHYHEFIVGVTRGVSTVEDTSLTSTTTQSLAIHEIPYRFRRVRSKGDIHIRDYEAVTPKEQEALIRKGIYFVGKGRQRPWYDRWLYNTIEFLTAYQYYIWNHDDNGNIFCHPHPYIQYKKLHKLAQQFDATYLLSVYEEHQQGQNNNQTSEERRKEGGLSSSSSSSSSSMMSTENRRIGCGGGGHQTLQPKKEVVQVAQSISSLSGTGMMAAPSSTISMTGIHKQWIPMTITTLHPAVVAASTGILSVPNKTEENTTTIATAPTPTAVVSPIRVFVYCLYQPIYVDIRGQSHTSIHPSVLRMQQQQQQQKKRLQELEEEAETKDQLPENVVSDANTKDRVLQQQPQNNLTHHHHQHHHAAVTIPGYSMYLRPVNCTVKAIDESKKKSSTTGNGGESVPKRRGGGGNRKRKGQGKSARRAKLIGIN